MRDLPLNPRLEQWLTPAWAAERIVNHYFPDLSERDLAFDAGCGDGAFLKAIASSIPAVGVELDPDLAQLARENSGREVIVGDFTTLRLDLTPTVILGNPPFSMDISLAFLRRAHDLLPDNGRCGFILPAYLFQTASTVNDLARSWSIRQDILPRNLFKTQEILRLPIVFALFTKERVRTLRGFFLHAELAEINGLAQTAKLLLIHPTPRKSVWRAVVDRALLALGGRGSLGEIYRFIEGRRPTPNPFWKEQVRKVLGDNASYRHVGEGCYALAEIPPFHLA